MTYSATSWKPDIYESDSFSMDGYNWRVASEEAHSFKSDGSNYRFEVRQGDRFSASYWTDAVGVERSEMGETSNHALSGNGSHFHATYQMMIEPGAKNTAQWLVTGQLFTGGTPPFEIKFMGNDKMAVVIKNGTSGSPIEKTVYLDSADIQRGKWYDMEIDVQLDANGSNGHAYVWRDGTKIANYTGKIGYTNATESHWEMGVYRKSPSGGESFAVNYKDVDLTYGAAGHSDTADSSPTPTPSDDPVVAADDSYAATEDAVLTVDATKGVLANDSAPDGGKAAVAGTFATAQGGSVKLAADGSFVYTPKADFFGTDSFSYTAKDADGDTDTGAVTFKVADVAETTPAPTPTPTPSPRPTTTTTINGTSRSEVLTGTSGNDLINGKSGHDKIWGMNGSDVLAGHSGNDTFVFASAGSNTLKLGSNNVDVIVDFNPADDTIQLGDSAFTKLAAGALSSSAFVVGTKALDSSDRIIYDNKTGDLSYDADGTGSTAAVKFAILENKATINAADFYII